MVLSADTEIKMGTVECEGWYDGMIVDAEVVSLAGGYQRARIVFFLLGDNHLAAAYLNLTDDPDSKIARLWRVATGTEPDRIRLVDLLGKQCRVYVVHEQDRKRPGRKFNRVIDFKPIQ
ncbi:MAG: hypothetical protein KatS3mg087_2193 [Patescibacteria group bacterium]|nr:MAG: hypothetical protein KatS3mg087_2193 [Patescibacteria group bacterium]